MFYTYDKWCSTDYIYSLLTGYFTARVFVFLWIKDELSFVKWNQIVDFVQFLFLFNWCNDLLNICIHSSSFKSNVERIKNVYQIWLLMVVFRSLGKITHTTLFRSYLSPLHPFLLFLSHENSHIKRNPNQRRGCEEDYRLTELNCEHFIAKDLFYSLLIISIVVIKIFVLEYQTRWMYQSQWLTKLMTLPTLERSLWLTPPFWGTLVLRVR